jgi:hypothetical protein
MLRFVTLAAMATAVAGPAAAQMRTPSPEGARAYIIAPADGAVVSGPVHVVFGLAGMGVAPAGIDVEATGHHHLLIDAPMLSAEEMEYSIPADATHVHFGKGQTETVLDLAPGPHTLQLLLGDRGHVPHDPPVLSEVVTITVR